VAYTSLTVAILKNTQNRLSG